MLLDNYIKLFSSEAQLKIRLVRNRVICKPFKLYRPIIADLRYQIPCLKHTLVCRNTSKAVQLKLVINLSIKAFNCICRFF